MKAERDYSHTVGDARKRLAAESAPEFKFDEQHAHLHEWPDTYPEMDQS